MVDALRLSSLQECAPLIFRILAQSLYLGMSSWRLCRLCRLRSLRQCGAHHWTAQRGWRRQVAGVVIALQGRVCLPDDR